jgi:hypothetical protein
MPKDHNQIMEEKIETTIELLRILVTLNLSDKGVPSEIIAKALHIHKSRVLGFLTGVKKK